MAMAKPTLSAASTRLSSFASESIMTSELLPILSQFGAAGLIGLMWIAERRHAAVRERQLDEAHGKLSAQDQALRALLDVVKENTRAIATLEQTQRQLIDLAQSVFHASARRKAAAPC